MRYFDTVTHTETYKESDTTIPQNDIRVKDFFKPLEDGYRLIFIEDMPVIEAIPAPTTEEITAKANQLLHDELHELDMESIGDIREWIASQPNAPQTLKDREAQAVSARAKIK